MMAKSKKGQVIKRSDAEERYDLARASTDPERTQRLLRDYSLLREFAEHNEALGAHMGRPRGSTGPTKKAEAEMAPAYAYMEQLNADGETRPYTLARLAVEAGKAPRQGGRASQIKRLGKYWIDQNVPK